jgi:hypothetical protein
MLLGIELLFNGVGLIVLAFFLRTVRGALKDRLDSRLNK